MFTSSEFISAVEAIKKEADIIQKVKRLSELAGSETVKIKDLAAALGVKSSYVCHLLRLERIPEAIIDGYYAKNISLSHLFVISRLKDSQTILKAYEQVLAENLTVKKTDELVRSILYGVKTQGEYLDESEKQEFIQKIKAIKKNVELEIIQTRIKSKLTVEFKGNLEDTSKNLRGFMKYFEFWK